MSAVECCAHGRTPFQLLPFKQVVTRLVASLKDRTQMHQWQATGPDVDMLQQRLVHRYDMPILPGYVGNLPRLGLGLSQIGTGSILAELLLVVLGALCHSRAADVVTDAAQRGRVRPMITAMLILSLRRNRK